MRTLASLVAAALLVLLIGPGFALANGDGTGIAGSPHDFTDNVSTGAPLFVKTENDDTVATAWNNKRKEICRVCHVPHDHKEVRYGNQGILWNHALSTKASWSMYASDPAMIDFIDGTVEAAPAGTSKLCLGCHDGVSALNQYDGKAPTDAGYGGGTVYTMLDYDSGFVIGNTTGSLTNNHPISITYNNTTDTGLHDPATAMMENGDTVASLLVNDRLECSTCHDVHNKDSVPDTHLLRKGTKGANVTGAGASDLCFVCHDK